MKQQTPKTLSPMEYAMKYLTVKDRTVSEMQKYLDGKDFGEADIDAAIARLIELGLLNDARYAQRFVETRLAAKPVSKRHLYEQLRGHGVGTAEIEAHTAGFPLKSVGGREQVSLSAALSSRPICQTESKAA